MKKNILSVIGAATVAAVALKLTTKYVKNEVIKELEDDGYLYDDDDCDDCDECCGCDDCIDKNEAGKNIPNRVCMTSDVKDAKEFTFEEAAAIQNDFSMVFPSLKKTRLVSTKVQSKPFDAIIAFEDVDGTEKFVAKNTRSRLFVALDEEGAKRYADKSSAQKVCAALNEKRYSRSVKNGSFRVKFLIPC